MRRATWAVLLGLGVGCARPDGDVGARLEQVAGTVAGAVIGTAQAAPRPKDANWSERGNTPLPVGYTPPTSLAPLIKELKPAVVNISTTQVVKRRSARRPGFPGQQDDPFNQFFDRFFQEPGGGGADLRRQSLGSGFIVNARGLVVTNNHVVEDASEIKVKLTDGREFSAKVLGTDPKTDLALLKLEGEVKDLPVVYLGDSDAIDVGDWVIAIGCPFGLDHTTSHGIVSAKERVIGAGPYDDFIQTDAPINPGNSGGPLFNGRGEVIGVNTAILSPGGGGSVGIGFAVPVNMLKDELLDLEQKGRVSRGWLGVSIQDLTPELARSLKLDQTHGAVVNETFPGGPADKGGVRAGDVVLKVNGKKVETFNQLLRGVASVEPGGDAKLEVFRDGKTVLLTVKVGERPEDEQLARAAQGSRQGADRLGLRVESLSAQGRGVVAAEVREASPAAAAGVQPGDVILEVNRRPVADAGAYLKAIAGVNAGDLVLLRVQRRNASLYIAVRAG